MYSIINSFVYLDESAKPSQNSGSINHALWYVNATLKTGHWIFQPRVYYQHSSDESIISKSDFISHLTISYYRPLFGNALYIEPGVDMFHFTEYYGLNYMPATRSFYLQSDKKIGSYMYADAFLNFRIKRAFFFLKYQHFNAGWFGYTYYTTPHFPMQDARVKFGIRWLFFD